MRGKRGEKQIIDAWFRYQNSLTCDVVFSHIDVINRSEGDLGRDFWWHGKKWL